MDVFFWIAAVLFSGFWGYHGWKTAEVEKKLPWEKAGYALSEFVGSVGGWVCLAILLGRAQVLTIGFVSPAPLGNMDIVLFLGAIVGISGWAFVIPESVDGWLRKKINDAKDK